MRNIFIFWKKKFEKINIKNNLNLMLLSSDEKFSVFF